MELIRLEKINKVFGEKETQVHALKDINFSINEGELVVILGASGAGKSTLLNILGGMDNPTSGNYFVRDKNIAQLNGNALGMFRRQDVGFVFQFYNLIPSLTALENVALAQSISKNPFSSEEIIKQVGLEKRKGAFPSSLSGGEQQRVAIARAVVKNPTLLLCDEPTGALDSKTGQQIITLLKDISVKENKTVIIVTHNAQLKDIADRVIRIQDGEIIENYLNENKKEVSDVQW